MDLINRGRSHLLLTFLLVKLLNVPGRQLLEGDSPQRREQILRDGLLVGLVGTFPDLWLNLVLEPVEEEGLHSFVAGTRQRPEETTLLGVL